MNARETAMVAHSWYEASVTRPPADAALQGALDVDVCIVGAGYSGLSAALELRQRGFSVAVLDAEQVAWGASGRNGGQVLVGFANDDTVLQQLGPAAARQAWDISVAGVHLLHARVARYGIDCDLVRGYLHVATSARKAEGLRHWTAQMRDTFGYDPISDIAPHEVRSWIDSPRYVGAAHDALSGHIHPLKYALGLADAARQAGVQLFAHSAVNRIEHGPLVTLHTAQGRVRSRFALIAANAYVGQLLGKTGARIMPVRSFIIATEPLPPEQAQTLIRGRAAVCDTNFMIDYFRLSADGRVLFGGRVTSGNAGPDALMPSLRARLAGVFPQLAHVAITHAWGGLVDVTMNRAPDFGRIAPNVYYLQGFCGHGVALTGMAGQMVAEAIAGQAERFDLFARLQHHRYPGGPGLHSTWLRLGVAYNQLKELV